MSFVVGDLVEYREIPGIWIVHRLHSEVRWLYIVCFDEEAAAHVKRTTTLLVGVSDLRMPAEVSFARLVEGARRERQAR